VWKDKNLGLPIVRNIFKMLECHERDDTTQKSAGQAKFTSEKGAHQKPGRHAHWAGSPQGFYLMPCCPSPAPRLQILGSQSTWLANWKEDIGRGL
jgi:hypothetical protein